MPEEAPTEAPPKTLGGWIDDLAARFDDRPALVLDETTVTFADLAARSRRVAAGLARLGIGPGDRVAVWLPSVPAWIELLLACGRLGAIVVSLNTRFRSLELGDILERSGARALVLWPGYGDIAAAEILAGIAPERLRGLEVVIGYGDTVETPILGRRPAPYASLAASEPWRGDEPDPDAGCLILTTSGTTSRPKFVLHAQSGLTVHARDVAAVPGWYGMPGSVGLTVMPLCGAFGLTQTLAALAGGAPSVLQLAFDPAAAAAAIRRHRVTNMAAVDEVFFRMLAACPQERPFPTLRCVVFGAFNGSPADFLRIAEPRGVRGVGAYGMSEFQGLFSFQPWQADAERRMKGGGVPASPRAEIRVRDVDTGALLGPGEVGELEVRAPSMMLRYFGDEAATAAAFTEDGFLRTGDSGAIVAEGGFEFVARMGDALRLSGFLVSPVEIAQHVETHASVAACQVVGAHGPDGYRPVAFVLGRGDAIDEEGLARHCRGALAKYKIPARFVPLAAFPMTDGPNGQKVQRAVLRQWAEEVLSGRPLPGPL